ncbi:CoA transferase, partial [Escherichia coli]|uniref:CoA transferase n=2 Tax=Escherichia coli TaxID=562 RepID=UPI003D1E0BAE
MDHLPMPKFGPLAGLRVVFSGIEIAGPFAGQMFAEWGAEVIWIENVAWADTIRVQPNYPQLSRRNLHALSLNIFKDEGREALMNPLMILVKIIKLRWIHILSYDQMVSRKINNQTTRCANSIFYTTL